MAEQQPRGVVCNNPLNLLVSGYDWQGKDTPTRDPKGLLESFKGMEWGFRAACRDLRNKYARGVDTVAEITALWAPRAPEGQENHPAYRGNDPEAYADLVAGFMKITPTTKLDLDDWATVKKLLEAMARVEQGGIYWTSADVERGMELAGLKRPLALTSTVSTATKTVGGAVLAAGGIIPAIQQVSQTVTILKGLEAYSAWLVVAAVAMVALLLILKKAQEHKGTTQE